MPKNFTKWNEEKIEWVKINYNKPYKEMSEYLGICDDSIRVKINSLGIKRDAKNKPYKLNMNDKRFLEDLDNPRLTAPNIVDKYRDKYGIGESRIHQLRKTRGIKLQVNTLKRISRSEKEVMNILDLLDLAYIREKRVNKYSIDFYLGLRLCIEVQEHYWHNKPSRVETDKRKKAFLEADGYKILYLWDNDLVNARDKIIEFLYNNGFPIQ